MLIKRNPFTSNLFVSKWLNHFNANRPSFAFNFIKGLTFFKPSFLPIYINTGRNLTKGISYSLNGQNDSPFNKSVILIYDVPTYFELDNNSCPENLKLHRIKQYPGYLIELERFDGLDDYMQTVFSKRSRYKLKKYQKRLELCYDINYKMFYGDISKREYDFIFDNFRKLLEKRFIDKQITNNNLHSEEWEFYYDVALPMILEKQASLFVVYEGSNPIGVSLNYFSENILFHAITVFDIDYSKFHLGKIALMNLLDWCFEKKVQYFDFSKGHFDYKTHWMNKAYDFEYHLYVDQSSIRSRIIAFFVKKYFELKQDLREKEFNKKLHQLTFAFQKKNTAAQAQVNYSFSEIEKEYKDSELLEIDILTKENLILKRIVNEFLYLNSEALKDLKILKVIESESKYIFKGKKNSKSLIIN